MSLENLSLKNLLERNVRQGIDFLESTGAKEVRFRLAHGHPEFSSPEITTASKFRAALDLGYALRSVFAEAKKKGVFVDFEDQGEDMIVVLSPSM